MMRLFFVVCVMFGTAFAQGPTGDYSDTEVPSGPGDYRSGFAAANFNGLPQASYEQWIDPGDEWFRVWTRQNADGSFATQEQINGAVATWEAMSRCNRWRVRMHHQSNIRRVHENQTKIFLYYITSIPAEAATYLVANCQTPNVFEALGHRFSVACARLNEHQAGLCSKFFPGDVMDEVVFGWESDAE